MILGSPLYLSQRLGGFVARRNAAPSVTSGTRVYAIGDIHGETAALTRRAQKIVNDLASTPSARPVLIFLGDYVDRGLDSRQVIDFLPDDPASGFEVVRLRGNHEAWMLAFLADARAGPEWLDAGGRATLLSYGVAPPSGPPDAAYFEMLREGFVHVLPLAHRTFLERLPLCHVEGDYAFVPAGIRPGVALADQREEDLLWIRDEFIHDRRDHGKIIVHGHSLTHRPEMRRNRIGIDTGAYATGRLTCLVLEGASRRFLAT